MHRLRIFGFVMIGGMAFAQLAAGQEAPAAKPAKHRIELAEPLAAGKTLEERLEAKGSFQAEEAALESFAKAMETALDTPVVLMAKKLEEAAINTETPLTYKLKNVRIRTALKLILGEQSLAYVIEDNVLLITTRKDSGSQLVTHVYDCRDLMKLPSPVRKVRYLRHYEQCLPPKKEEERPQEPVGPDGGYNIDDLVEVILNVVAPDSWEGVGGSGSIKEFKGFLSVSQTQEVHEQVEKLLNQLHKAGGLEEMVKVSR